MDIEKQQNSGILRIRAINTLVLIYKDIIQTKYLHVGGLIISLSHGIITLITASTESLAPIQLAQLRRYKTISDMGSFVKQLVVLVLQRLGKD